MGGGCGVERRWSLQETTGSRGGEGGRMSQRSMERTLAFPLSGMRALGDLGRKRDSLTRVLTESLCLLD